MKGSLGERCAADVLGDVQRRQWSGILRLHRGDLVRQLFIDAGGIVRFAVSTLPEESMTALLKEQGGATDEQLRQATAAKSAQELLGATLVRLGFITRGTLISLTEDHIRKVVQGALAMDRGEYEFQQGALPFREQMDAGLTTAELLLDWARGVPDLEWIQRRLGRPDALVRRAQRPPQGYQEVPLDASEGYIMSRVDGTSSVHEICIVSPIGDEATLRALLGLALAGIIEMPDGAPDLPLPAGGGMARAAPPARPSPEAERPPARSAPLPPARTSLPVADPPAAATGQQARRAPPPARVAPPPAPAAPRPASPAPDHIAARAPGNGGAPKPASTAPRNAAGMKERIGPSAAAGLEGEMLKRFEQIHDQNLYEVLGVSPTAKPEEIRRSYYALARKFHPDKFTDEAIKAKAEKAFGKITEAYSTLSHEDTRKKYDEEQFDRHARSHDKAAEPAELARQNFRHGREQFDKGKFSDAVAFLENACEQDPTRAEYFHYLGLVQTKNPRWKKKAEENLLKAIQLAPSDAQIYADLGTLYAKGGLHSKAREMFRTALQWDPANAEASEGLAAEEGGKKGLLGGLFHKR